MMMFRVKTVALLATPLMLAACVTAPTAPSVMVLPGTGKTFDQFRIDDANCRNYAYQSIGGPASNQQATDKAVAGALIGTVVGAAAGAAIGGNSRGTAVGAGTGLLFGTAAGSNAGYSTGYGQQRLYDNAYVQCMYASGNRVPVSGQMGYSRTLIQQTAPAAAPAGTEPPPPPPAGSPPPPPPGYTSPPSGAAG